MTDKAKETKLLSDVVGCFAMLAYWPVGVFIWAWLLAVQWGWFVVPLGVVMIGKAQAYGLTLLISGMRANTTRKEETKNPGAIIATDLAFFTICALASLLAHWLMVR